ncbi:glutathione synthase/RimK-type ligase-like ATP-grasp enzyme [Methylobacter tundripaludum]|jgi:glutathione synthase/RimK-type ligase-like ATP-grasp enzyme|uniref:Glutathione synthase/RimK-type ligase-like ATP-grasp enzyme n=1 Tax=Methylobacter tundripaludum TaxID=173365 RepID=A0A2S6HE76_9GAMM|nr:RimK family protein [Methylobacter tundripaludum]PPK75799.1 glutathione synthase/RimK-type ligase-like ATP-grasp enzyme [Methylobacter tundripaludum]
MARTLLVVDDLSDWNPYYPSDQVITFETYLATEQGESHQRVRIINLCSSYRYLSDGYYCSLLAEARGHHVIPSVKVLNDLGKKALYRLQLEDLSQTLARAFKSTDKDSEITLMSYFGTTPDPAFQELTRLLFERFSCPILEVTLRCKQQWEIIGLKAVSHRHLDDAMQTVFADALDKFSTKVWRKGRARKAARFDLAILVNPEEQLPPSNRGALKKFIKIGRELGIEIELITQQHYVRLPEFDGLFIRETTNIDHHTYRFAKKAEAEGLVVIDDPTSMLRCTNKVYLADLFRTHKVPTPKTWLLHKGNAAHLDRVEAEAGFPMVVKIPDGSFSRGIVKVNDRKELELKVEELFQKSALLLAQEFLYTDFDWRIGVFNNKALYACRYYMVKNHWQIYRHGSSKIDTGSFATLPTFEVPKAVLDAALKATQPIGNGLYGVDVKEKDGKGYVIEVNDNPNIDSGVEDKYLGDELYRLIMTELLRRMENRSKGILTL